MTEGTEYTLIINIAEIANCELVISVGEESPPMKTKGIHMVNLTASSYQLVLGATMTGTGYVEVESLYILVGRAISENADQTEIPWGVQNLMVLYATYCGLVKNKKIPPASMLHSIYTSELAYIRKNVTEPIPDAWTGVKEY